MRPQAQRGLGWESISAARAWFTAAGAANVGATFGLVTVFWALAAMIGGDLYPAGHGGVRIWIILGVAGGLAQVSFSGLSAVLAARGAAIVERTLRRRLLAELFARNAPATGSAVAARLVIEEARKVASAAERWEPLRVQAAGVPAVIIGFTFATNWLVGLLLLVAAPLIPLNMAIFGMGADGLSRRQAEQVAQLDELVLDRIKGARTLAALGAVEREGRRVRRAADELAGRALSVLRVALLSSAALEALITYAVAMSATYIGLVLLGYVKIGWAPTSLDLRGAIFLLLLAPAFFQPFRDLAAAYHDHQDVKEATAVLASCIRTAPGPAPEPGPGRGSRTLRAGLEAVRAEDVSLRYPGTDVDVLCHLDWTVPVGTIAGIAGPSGVGKSTLLRLVAGRLEPTAGALRRPSGGCAWLGQRPYFFQTSIRENLLVACPAAAEHDLWRVLASVGLKDVVAHIPGGLDARLGWDGRGLSGGQARRLALARALLGGAGTLILDEPTAHLDPATEADIVGTIGSLPADRTIIVASHSPVVLAACSQVLYLTENATEELVYAG